MNYPNLFQIITDIKFEEIEKIKDFDGFDPSAKGQIEGIKIMAKALREKLENE